jgi:hypothetical protein
VSLGNRMSRAAGGSPRAGAYVLLAVWGLATAAGLVAAATTKIGPVVVALSYRHGVHVGDLVAFAACYAAALPVTVRTTRYWR